MTKSKDKLHARSLIKHKRFVNFVLKNSRFDAPLLYIVADFGLKSDRIDILFCFIMKVMFWIFGDLYHFLPIAFHFNQCAHYIV